MLLVSDEHAFPMVFWSAWAAQFPGRDGGSSRRLMRSMQLLYLSLFLLWLATCTELAAVAILAFVVVAVWDHFVADCVCHVCYAV